MPLPRAGDVARPQSLGYGARLGDLLVRLVGNAEVVPVVQSARPEATRLDTGESPEDFVSEQGQTFSRAQFAGGEGLGYAHRAGAAPDRFWDSEHVDVSPPQPGDRDAIRLLHLVTPIRNDSANANLHLATDGESLWVVSGLTVLRTDDPTAAEPVFTEDDPQSGIASQTVRGLARLGNELYAACGSNGIRKRSAAGTWSNYSDVGLARSVWAVKRRVLAQGGADADGRHLRETTAAASTILATLPAGSGEWSDVIDADSHVLAAATDGSVYAFTAVEGATLELVAEVRIPFEQPVSLGHLGGVVLIGTRRPTGSGSVGRLWRADLLESGNLTNLTLIRQWGHGDDTDDDLDHAPTAITVEKESAYLGVTEHLHYGDRTNLWRYDFGTGGRVRHLAGRVNSDTPTVGVLSLKGRLFFSIANEGVFREDLDEHRQVGHLITPLADHFTALEKNWTEVSVDAEVGPELQVVVWYTTEAGAINDPESEHWVKVIHVIGGQGATRTVLGDVRSRFLALKVELKGAGPGGGTPEVRSVSVTALVAGDEVVVTLPINTSDQLELPGRRRHNAVGLGERVHREVALLQGSPVELELYRPRELVQGHVQSVAAPVPLVTGVGSRLLVTQVEVRGRRIGLNTALELDGSDGTWAECPSTDELEIGGDIDLRWFGLLEDWTASARLITKGLIGLLADDSFMFYKSSGPSGGSLRLHIMQSDGESSEAQVPFDLPFDPGELGGLRVTWRQSDGRTQFFTSHDDGETWVQLGSDRDLSSVAFIKVTAHPLKVGYKSSDESASDFGMTGLVRRIEVRDGIDGALVASPDFTQPPWQRGDDAGSPSRGDAQGNPWSLAGNAVISRQDDPP